ncbi:Plant UBX domain-containing protein 4 [Ancistrocladus abbreviatus]
MDQSKEASAASKSESQLQGQQQPGIATTDHLINTFIEITTSTADEAQFFLESHNFDLDAAVSTFLESTSPTGPAPAPAANAGDAAHLALPNNSSPSHSRSRSASSPSASLSNSSSSSASRSRSPSPPSQSRSLYNLRSRRPPPMASSNPENNKSNDRNDRRNSSSCRRVGGIHTFADLHRSAREDSGSDSDRPPEYYTGGEKSGMVVQDRSNENDVEAIFSQARQMGAVLGPADLLQQPSNSRGFTGTGRLLSGETVPSAQQQQPGVITHTITFWRNGFTVDGGPLRRLDDPENAPFLESIRNSECPKELETVDRRTQVHVNLVRKDDNCLEPEKQQILFQGVGRTLGGSSSSAPPASEPSAVATSLNSIPTPTTGLIVDENQPSTSIQLRLADGTRMVSRFNYHHTIRDIRGFIDASRPGKVGAYKLQTVGFPPKQLTDLDQTIEQAGLANSVVIQKF